MKRIKSILVGLFLLAGLNLSAQNVPDIAIGKLKVEYTETPLGIDEDTPRFSWQMQSDMRGCFQTAYRLTVIDEKGENVWDSNKTDSDVSLNIKYAGSPLKPFTRYRWEVVVWDQKNKPYKAASWFETGIMNSPEGWSGAKWIGGESEDRVLYAHYLPVFKLSYSVQLDKATRSTKAGFIYGANDSRLMDKNKNLYHLESKTNNAYIQVEIDIADIHAGGQALLNIYRSGYHPQDKDGTPFKSYPVARSIINKENMYDIHTVFISSAAGDTHIHIDGRDPANLIARINLNPLGQGGDFIAFPVLGDIGYSVPHQMTAYFSGVEVRNYRSPSNILFSESSPHKIEGGSGGFFATKTIDKNSMPMLRTSFPVSKAGIVKARLYATSRGIYDIYLNGKRIGDDYFNPGLTQYNKTHLYQTFDVTEHIRSGQNVMGALLGEGWWSGGATYMPELWNFFGDRQSLLAKLVITYSDGKEDVIVTDPSTWTCYSNGPVIYGSFFQGEVYDASKEQAVEGWSTPAYDDSEWKKVVEVPLEETVIRDMENNAFNMPLAEGYANMSLAGQFGETVRKIRELTAVSVEEVRPKVFVYDMGQNMAGVPQITLNGMERGQHIVLRFAEVKYPDLPEYREHTGMIMLENIRAAMAQDIYISKGGSETISPRFTFHGYRYIEITGIAEPLPLEAVKANVLSSVHELTASYVTSNPKVNKLWDNITWSMYSNFLSIPTDCPQRNERLGWSGDISVFSRTAVYLSNASQFLRRHLRALRDTQRQDGRFADVAPLGGGFGGMLWGSAGITVAWEGYLQYNDKAMLSEHYDAMKRYINYLLEKNIDRETGLLVQENPGAWGNLGDWLSPEDDKNDKTLLWEAYFIYDLEIMKKTASVLGKDEDARYFDRLHAERKDFFNKTYIDAKTGKTVYADFYPTKKGKNVDTQTSYVLPLTFDIVSEANEAAVLNEFVAAVVRENYSLMTGFIGTAWISKALSDRGYSDAAYRLLQQTAFPSWLYPVTQGATTIWERLNSYTHSDGFGGNNRMNSFNHYSFGAVGAWMCNYSSGIERDENHPGFKYFILKPEPDPTGEMTHAIGHYDSMYGRIESAWEVKNKDCYYRLVVPANTSATLHLKATSIHDITENGKALNSSAGVKYAGFDNGKYTFELQSGIYNIKVQNLSKKQ
ncbi:MAG: glycoside hydrolase family 78 protein [Tannerella sp.]|nr:glycoside hydrolase family 78 protein [Tannerella sp.]